MSSLRAPALCAALAAASILSPSAHSQCNTAVDIVFAIDGSSSMTDEVLAIRDGMVTFVANLQTQNVDARFAVVLFGKRPELLQDFADGPTTISTLSCIRSRACRRFHSKHPKKEPGLETIRMILGGAVQNAFPVDNCINNGLCDPQHDGLIQFRQGVPKNIILVTDEDSDRPFYRENRMPNQRGGNPPKMTSNKWPAWEMEIDVTAQLVADSGAFLNLLVNPSRNRSAMQYGDPAVDVADLNLRNYQRTATLFALQNSPSFESMQAETLRRGGFARTFDIQRANDPVFVENFFAVKLDEICCPCTEPASWAPFGVGVAGTGGQVPPITMTDVPRYGQVAEINIGNPTGAVTHGCLLIAPDLNAPPLSLIGGTLYPSLGAGSIFFPFDLQPGGSLISLPIPGDDTTFCGLTLYGQALIEDPGAGAFQTAFTEGLEMTIGC